MGQIHEHIKSFQLISGEVSEYSLLLLDLDGTILTWNKGVEKLKGYSSSEIIGQNINMFYLPQDRMVLPKILLNEAKNNGTAYHIGKRMRKNGTIFWGKIEITAIKDENDQVIGFTNIARELKDEVPTGQFWFDTDGVLHGRANNQMQTAENLHYYRELIKDNLSNGKLCCITDLRDAYLSEEGLTYTSDTLDQYYKAIAFVTDPKVDESTKRVYPIFANKIPAKVFTSRDEAKAWIKQYI